MERNHQLTLWGRGRVTEWGRTAGEETFGRWTASLLDPRFSQPRIGRIYEREDLRNRALGVKSHLLSVEKNRGRGVFAQKGRVGAAKGEPWQTPGRGGAGSVKGLHLMIQLQGVLARKSDYENIQVQKAKQGLRSNRGKNNEKIMGGPGGKI